MFNFDDMERAIINAALKAFPDKTEDDIIATFVSETKGTVLFDGHVKFVIEY